MADQAIATKRSGYVLETDLMPIIEGNVALPNAKPVTRDVGAALLHYREMHCGTALLAAGKKEWNARFFLDYGQGGGLHGSGLVAWTAWKDGAYRATAMTFAICDHKAVEGGGANHSRGWHPARCEKCGLDLSVDSGD
jgi:hypothetical protein